MGRDLDVAVAKALGYQQVFVQGTEFWQYGNEPADFLKLYSKNDTVALQASNCSD